MRFFYAKKEQVCRYCRAAIQYNDEAVIERWKTKEGIIIPLVVHTVCYIPWKENSFNQQWNDWKMEATPRRTRKKRGRKTLYKEEGQAKLMNQLKTLRNYHNKAGNIEAVRILDKRIKELEYAHI